MEGSRQFVGERGIVVVGAVSLQNKLLARLIAERTGYTCEVRTPDQPVGDVPVATLLVLLDAAECPTRLAALCGTGLYPNVAVINADPGEDWDHFVSYPGVKGVFGSDVTETQLVRGIEAIFRGEYWLPRRILWTHLERTRRLPQPAAQAPGGMLTRKEIATLRLLAAGNSTEHIASALKVSPHTVKTHIYNLFRKIQVSNRVQAVHWAARNLAVGDFQQHQN